MAEKTKTGDIERIYTIPLRKGWLKEPRSKRSNRARREIEIFLKRHTKAGKIKFSKGLNELVFSQGFKKPPGKVKVEVKGDFETLQAKIPGEVIEIKKEEKKKGVAGLKERFMKTEEEKAKEKKKEELKRKVEEKVKEATSDERIKEAVSKVEKEGEKKQFKEKGEKK
jgi:ribosomal protein L31E